MILENPNLQHSLLPHCVERIILYVIYRLSLSMLTLTSAAYINLLSCYKQPQQFQHIKNSLQIHLPLKRTLSGVSGQNSKNRLLREKICRNCQRTFNFELNKYILEKLINISIMDILHQSVIAWAITPGECLFSLKIKAIKDS